MNTSVAWINQYLDRPASAAEQAEVLMRAGFPVEHSEEVALPDGSGDIRQDVELTSNRGDCLSHVGLAGEIAALSDRRLKAPRPAPKTSSIAASTIVKVTNREPVLCPLYTARVIRGVKVGPSPKWLANRLIARGDIPRNNIVDASNFVLFELGQPTHVFDLAKLRGKPPQIIVRRALPNEPFLPIGEGATEIKLCPDDLVIADAERAVAIAGVKGGAPTAVTNATTDLLIETATFAASTVRASGRRHGIASDSAYRFERGIHPGQLALAADRLAELILELCGGTLCAGSVDDGALIPPLRQVKLRFERCRRILGLPLTDAQITSHLARLGFEPKPIPAGRGDSAGVSCTVPCQRLDVEREADLIEEVGRISGLDAIPIAPTMSVRIGPPQPADKARRAVSDAMVGMGFVETVTHSLVSEQAARAFLAPGMEALRVADERAKAEPVLRPSVLASLLRVYALNRDNGSPDARLFETASTFALISGKPAERVNLAFVFPSPHAGPDEGVRTSRGVIDRLAQMVIGRAARIEVEPHDQIPWFAPGGVIRANGDILGTLGVIAPAVTASFGITQALIAAEIGLPAYYDRFPPDTQAHALPSFPAIERDLSAIVDERLRWIEVKSAVESLRLQHLEAIDFVTTFRGKQIGAGRKSLTLRTRFRAADRTLTHNEVDPQMASVIKTLQSKFGAEIRS